MCASIAVAVAVVGGDDVDVVRAYIKTDQIIKLLLTRFIFIDYDLTHTTQNTEKSRKLAVLSACMTSQLLQWNQINNKSEGEEKNASDSEWRRVRACINIFLTT